MATIKTTARETTDLVADGEKEVAIKSLRNGTLSMAQFVEVMSFEGRVFSVCGSSATATQEFGAVGVVTTTEPDLMIHVPSGVSIIPLEIVLVIETYGTEALFEFMASIGQGATTALGTDSDITPINVNLGHARASSCTCGVASSATAVYMTDNVIEFWRGCESKAVTIGHGDDDNTFQPVNFSWRAKDAGYYPICNGEGGLSIFVGTESGTGFIQCRYLEVPSDWLS